MKSDFKITGIAAKFPAYGVLPEQVIENRLQKIRGIPKRSREIRETAGAPTKNFNQDLRVWKPAVVMSGPTEIGDDFGSRAQLPRQSLKSRRSYPSDIRIRRRPDGGVNLDFIRLNAFEDGPNSGKLFRTGIDAFNQKYLQPVLAVVCLTKLNQTLNKGFKSQTRMGTVDPLKGLIVSGIQRRHYDIGKATGTTDLRILQQGPVGDNGDRDIG